MTTKRQEQHTKLCDLQRSRLGETAFYHEPQQHSYGIDPEDGLPRLKVPPMSQTQAPPYDPDTFVCAKDPRIVDDAGNVYPESSVLFDEEGPYLETTPEGTFEVEKIRLSYARPPCKHYQRQLVRFEDDPDRRAMIRICSAQKNENGEFYGLNDQEIFACTLREPRDERSELRLDAHENKIVEQQEKAQEKEDDFDPTEALKEGGGGIFDGEDQ